MYEGLDCFVYCVLVGVGEFGEFGFGRDLGVDCLGVVGDLVV